METGKYGLPLDVKYCKKCTRSNQRPAVTQEFLQNQNQKKNLSYLTKKVYVADVLIIILKIIKLIGTIVKKNF